MNEEKSSYLNLPHRVYEVTVKENFLNNKISCLIYFKKTASRFTALNVLFR